MVGVEVPDPVRWWRFHSGCWLVFEGKLDFTHLNTGKYWCKQLKENTILGCCWLLFASWLMVHLAEPVALMFAIILLIYYYSTGSLKLTDNICVVNGAI